MNKISLSKYSLIGLGCSLFLHLSAVMAIATVGHIIEQTFTKPIQQEKLNPVFEVTIEKFAMTSSAPNPHKQTKHLSLAAASSSANKTIEPKLKKEPTKEKEGEQEKIKPIINSKLIQHKQQKKSLTPTDKTSGSIINSGNTSTSSQDKNSKGTGNITSAATNGALRASYEQVVLSKLERVKNYPNKPLRRRLEGDVLLFLQISNQGEVINRKIKNSSGYDFFDEEVLSMVSRVGKFPPPPEEVSSNTLSFIIPVAFRLN